MTALFPLALTLAILSLSIALIAHLCGRRVLSRRVPRTDFFPPISILKPLKGLDDGLYENLTSFAKLDYPVFELICGAEDAGDPALEVARRVQRENPQARIRLIQCRGYRGKNPKVRSLQALSAQARFEHWMISDSNVRVDRTWLRDTAAELSDPKVALVTNPIAPLGGEDETTGALFENLHLGAFVLGAIALPRVLANRACVVGKSMLLRKDALEAVGGFRSVRNLLAEDYLLGRKLELAGYRVALSPCPVYTLNQSWTLDRFSNRHIRWGQMRRRLCLPAYAGEVLLNPVPLIGAALALRVAQLWVSGAPANSFFSALWIASGAVAFKCLLDMSLISRLRGYSLDILDIAWIPVKDLWIAAISRALRAGDRTALAAALIARRP